MCVCFLYGPSGPKGPILFCGKRPGHTVTPRGVFLRLQGHSALLGRLLTSLWQSIVIVIHSRQSTVNTAVPYRFVANLLPGTTVYTTVLVYCRIHVTRWCHV